MGVDGDADVAEVVGGVAAAEDRRSRGGCARVASRMFLDVVAQDRRRLDQAEEWIRQSLTNLAELGIHRTLAGLLVPSLEDAREEKP
jgi:hypothetical protein